MTATRPAQIADSESIAAIYNQGIEDRIATFETRLRTPGEVREWFTTEHVVVIAEEQGRPVAFGVTHPYSPRPCYSGIAEVSVYVGREARGRGVGQAVLEEIIRQAAGRGWWKLIGRVFAENSASRALCRKCGFREVGTHYAHARLDEVWVDVVVVERAL